MFKTQLMNSNGSFILRTGLLIILAMYAQEMLAQNYRGKHFYKANDMKIRDFDSVADFYQAHFHSEAFFINSGFNSDVSFCFTQFHSLAGFYGTHFSKVAFFNDAKFHSYAHFENAKFLSCATFKNAHFDSTADFNMTFFNSIAIFNGTRFYNSANFSNAIFQSQVDFSNSQFHSTVTFNGTKLPDTIDFRNIKIIEEEIDFTVLAIPEIGLNPKYHIALTGTNITKIKINYELFRIYFMAPDTTYEQKISVYEKLLQKFKTDGFIESYKKLDIEYREFKYLNEKEHFLNWFHKNWWNYGYNKEKVIWWSLFFFCFFTTINIMLFNTLQCKVYSMNFDFFTKTDFNLIKGMLLKYSLFGWKKFFKVMFYREVLIYGFSLFKLIILNPLIYTGILFFGLKVSLGNFKKLNVGTIWVFIIYSWGLFCLAYIFNIIIIK